MINFKLLCIIYMYSLLSTKIAYGWDLALIQDAKLIFYDYNCTALKTIENSELMNNLDSGLLYNADRNEFYFSNLKNDSAIFSYSLNSSSFAELAILGDHKYVRHFAYSTQDKKLYFSVSRSKTIYVVEHQFDNFTNLQPFIQLGSGKVPKGLVVDNCNRFLYWINYEFKKSKIMRTPLDNPSVRSVIVDSLIKPQGLALDSDKLYWTDEHNIESTIKSYDLKTGSITVWVTCLYQTPVSLVVTGNLIFWTDIHNDALWKFDMSNLTKGAEKMIDFYNNRPGGLVTKASTTCSVFAFPPTSTTMPSMSLTSDSVHVSASPIPTDSILPSSKSPLVENKPQNVPVNEVAIKQTTESPIVINPVEDNVGNSSNDTNPEEVGEVMLEDFRKGHRNSSVSMFTNESVILSSAATKIVTQMPIVIDSKSTVTTFNQLPAQINQMLEPCKYINCDNKCVKNFCLNGGRYKESNSWLPECECDTRFSGARCETDLCRNLCLNGGTCRVTADVACDCTSGFFGPRCEHALVANRSDQTESKDFCLLCGQTIYYVAYSLAVATMVLLTVTAALWWKLRKVSRRPRVTRRFIVEKKEMPVEARRDSGSTVRTIRYGPGMEMCEITIENCCNMTVCDNPCYEPAVACNPFGGKVSMRKEEKKKLLDHLEGPNSPQH